MKLRKLPLPKFNFGRGKYGPPSYGVVANYYKGSASLWLNFHFGVSLFYVRISWL